MMVEEFITRERLAVLGERALVLAGVVLFLVAGILVSGVVSSLYAFGPIASFSMIFGLSLSRPQAVTPGTVFLSGLICDIFGSGPLGMWTFVFMITAIIVRRQGESLVEMPRLAVLVAFALDCVFMLCLAWGVMCLYYGRILDPTELMDALVMAVAIFLPISYFTGLRPARYHTGL